MNRSPIRHKPKRQASPNAIDYSGFAFPKARVLRESGSGIKELRLKCFLKYRGKCDECGKDLQYTTIWDGHPDRYHMAHKRTKRNNGDSLSNVRALCGTCHRTEHGNPVGKD